MFIKININGVEEYYRIITTDKGVSTAWPVGADGRLPESQIGAIDLDKVLDIRNKERRDMINEQIKRSK